MSKLLKILAGTAVGAVLLHALKEAGWKGRPLIETPTDTPVAVEIFPVYFVRTAMDAPASLQAVMSEDALSQMTQGVDDVMATAADQIRQTTPDATYVVFYSRHERVSRSGRVLQQLLDGGDHPPVTWLTISESPDVFSYPTGEILQKISRIHREHPNAEIVLVTHETMVARLSGVHRPFNHGEVFRTNLEVQLGATR